jgi:hypothetical protein
MGNCCGSEGEQHQFDVKSTTKKQAVSHSAAGGARTDGVQVFDDDDMGKASRGGYVVKTLF